MREEGKGTQTDKEDLPAVQKKTVGAVQPHNKFHISAFLNHYDSISAANGIKNFTCLGTVKLLISPLETGFFELHD